MKKIKLFWLCIAIVSSLSGITAAVSLLVVYNQLGHTPGELMDYSERRLQGHPRIEFVALPILAAMRDWLNAPSLGQRLSHRFIVPPPPLTLTQDIGGSSADTGRPTNVLRVGKAEAIRTIAEAARAARDGDIVEIQAGEYHADVALWSQKKLTIRGVGGNARLFADGASAEGKAIWVIRSGDFTIENIDFIGARVYDHNGAGIRFENGHLRVKNCLFWDNENGILTADVQREARLEIVNSEFGYNGDGDGRSHNIYVGRIGSLQVTGSYFHHANVGHLLKSRAAVNDILYNRLTDETGGRASYELDLPNGGIATVMGNIIQQNSETENSTLISYGREGYLWPENRLYLANNTLVNDHPYGGAFLRAADGANSLVSMNNLLVGKGKYHTPSILTSTNDINVGWEIFNQASRYDYRLAKNGQQLTYRLPAKKSGHGIDLLPTRQYLHPRQTIEITDGQRYPGALQIAVPAEVTK